MLKCSKLLLLGLLVLTDFTINLKMLCLRLICHTYLPICLCHPFLPHCPQNLIRPFYSPFPWLDNSPAPLGWQWGYLPQIIMVNLTAFLWELTSVITCESRLQKGPAAFLFHRKATSPRLPLRLRGWNQVSPPLHAWSSLPVWVVCAFSPCMRMAHGCTRMKYTVCVFQHLVLSDGSVWGDLGGVAVL